MSKTPAIKEHVTKVRSAKTLPKEVTIGNQTKWIYKEVCSVYIEQQEDVDKLAQLMAGGYELQAQFTLPSGVVVALVIGAIESKLEGLKK